MSNDNASAPQDLGSLMADAKRRSAFGHLSKLGAGLLQAGAQGLPTGQGLAFGLGQAGPMEGSDPLDQMFRMAQIQSLQSTMKDRDTKAAREKKQEEAYYGQRAPLVPQEYATGSGGDMLGLAGVGGSLPMGNVGGIREGLPEDVRGMLDIASPDDRLKTLQAMWLQKNKPRDPFTLGEGQQRFDSAGRVIAEGPPKREPRDPALQNKISEIRRAFPDADDQTVTAIATGVVSVVPDQTYGGVHIVDKLRGTSKYLPPSAAPQEAPQTAPQPSASSVPPDVDYAQGTGASGFFGWGINTITDVLSGKLAAPEAEKASQGLTNLQVRTQTALQAGIPGRPSNYLMEQLGKLSISPGNLFQGDSRAYERLRQTRDMIKEEVARIDRDILSRPGEYSRGQIAETRANRSQLESILRNYDTVVESFERSRKPSGTLSPEDDALIRKYRR